MAFCAADVYIYVCAVYFAGVLHDYEYLHSEFNNYQTIWVDNHEYI